MVWTRVGDGHYEAVVKNPALKTLPTEPYKNKNSVPDRDLSYYIDRINEQNGKRLGWIIWMA